MEEQERENPLSKFVLCQVLEGLEKQKAAGYLPSPQRCFLPQPGSLQQWYPWWFAGTRQSTRIQTYKSSTLTGVLDSVQQNPSLLFHLVVKKLRLGEIVWARGTQQAASTRGRPQALGLLEQANFVISSLQPISALGNHLISGCFREIIFSNWFWLSTSHVWMFSLNVSMNSFIPLTDPSWRSFCGNQMPYLLNYPLHKAQVVENRHHTSKENNDG